MKNVAEATYKLTKLSMRLQDPPKVNVIRLLAKMKRKLDAEGIYLAKKFAH